MRKCRHIAVYGLHLNCTFNQSFIQPRGARLQAHLLLNIFKLGARKISLLGASHMPNLGASHTPNLGASYTPNLEVWNTKN